MTIGKRDVFNARVSFSNVSFQQEKKGLKINGFHRLKADRSID